MNGNQPWTDTQINVKKGDGSCSRRPGRSASPAETRPTRWRARTGPARFNAHRTNYPYPGMAVGGLVAKVGNDKPFAIGSINTPISMPDNGRLYLGINDDGVGDNSGAFYVTITRVGK